jgi:hypothetical protein
MISRTSTECCFRKTDAFWGSSMEHHGEFFYEDERTIFLRGKSIDHFAALLHT